MSVFSSTDMNDRQADASSGMITDPSGVLTPDPQSLLEAALHYASLGLEVLPCRPNGEPIEKLKKAPLGRLVTNGVDDATTDAANITEWWEREPRANIGLRMGADLLVIDVDRKKGADGYADLAEMEATLGALPSTPFTTTPSGGRHYFFKPPVLPDGVRIKGRAKIKFNGRTTSIDLRVGDQYVLAPPSVVDDKVYSVEDDYRLARNADGSLNVAELPPEWVAVLPKHGERAQPVAGEARAYSPLAAHSPERASEIERCRRYVQKLPPAIEGANGSGDCFHAACIIFWDFGLDELEGRPILDEFNARCTPPWNDADLRHKISDALAHSGKTTLRGCKLNDREPSYSPSAKNEPKKEPRKSRLIATPMNEHDARATRWLWEGRIPLGEVTLINGSPGSGKTTLMTHLCAVVSSGGIFVDGSLCKSPGKVLYISTEASLDVFWAGLKASGADMQNVFIAAKREGDEGDKLLRFRDVGEIDLFLSDNPGYVAIIFDPAGSFLGGDTDAHRDNEVRDELNPVGNFAKKHGVAVIIATHPSKSGRNCTHADESVLGSTGFVALARAVWHCVTHPIKVVEGDKEYIHRILAGGKMNTVNMPDVKPPGVLRFRLEGVLVVAPKSGDTLAGLRVVKLPAEDGDDHANATDIFREIRSAEKQLERASKPLKDTETSRAGDFLDSIFQGGKVAIAAKEVERQWVAQGYNVANLQRPRDRKGIKATRVTLADEPQFSVWHLPSVKVTKDGIATTDAGEAITITRHNPLGCRTVKRPAPKED